MQTEQIIEFKPDRAFWNRWRDSKTELLRAGFRVFKRGDDWIGTQRIWIDEPDPIFLGNLPELTDTSNLREYQLPSVQRLVYAVRTYGGGLDQSDTGTGKTYVALGVAKNLGLPVFIVCPVPAIPSWKRAIKLTETECLGIVNYEHLRTKKNKYVDRDKEEIFLHDCLVIYDEAHKVKNIDTINSEIALLFYQKKYKMLFLSATLADKPQQLETVARCSGLLDRQSWNGFLSRIGVSIVQGTWGIEYAYSPDSFRKLNKILVEECRATRIRKADLPEQFKKAIIEPILVDFGKEVQKAYSELYDKILHYEKLEDKATGLVETLRARQKCELAKVGWFVSSAREYMEEGLSVICFVNFRETGQAIAEQLQCDFIFGDRTPEEREGMRQRFQRNENHCLVLTSATGGASIDLHDIAGRQRISLISPTWSAQELLQIFGRTDRDGSLSPSICKIVFAESTIEESVYESVLGKVENISTLNDGDMQSFSLTKV